MDATLSYQNVMLFFSAESVPGDLRSFLEDNSIAFTPMFYESSQIDSICSAFTIDTYGKTRDKHATATFPFVYYEEQRSDDADDVPIVRHYASSISDFEPDFLEKTDKKQMR